MDSSERHALIVERLRRDGCVDVVDLAEALGTSEVTVRRDLDQLSEVGILRRIHGGAVSMLMRGDEPPFAMRELEAAAAKSRIGAAAAAMLRDGEAVVVDSGTTGVAVARALAGRRLTVLPLSLQAAGLLSGERSVSLLLSGGSVRAGEGTIVGPLAEASLATLRFDTTILSCCGLSSDAVFAHDLGDAAVKRAAVNAAARTILVADGAKFARTALALVCPAERVDIVITDASAPEDAIARLRDLGVEVLVA